MKLSRQQLAASRVVVDRFSPDSVSLARWLAPLGARVRIVDAGPIPPPLVEPCRQLAQSGVALQPSTDPNALAPDFDLIFADLFHPPTRPFIVEARRRGQLVSMLADVVLQFSPLPAIGVTGSAGKSTTALLLYDMLAVAGQKTYMGRDSVMENLWPNYEVLDQLDEMRPPGWLLLELTSSHLEYMHASPHIAIVTILWPDHVDWHGSVDAYFSAKKTILAHQSGGDWAILNYDDKMILEQFAPHCRGQVAYFSQTAQLSRGVFVRDGDIVARWDGELHTILPVADVPLGNSYLINVLAACAGALAAGLPIPAIAQAIPKFRGLPHRLEFVAEVGGVRIYADGMAITPSKARAGIDSFPDRSLILIAGGAVSSDYSDGLHSSAEEHAQVVEACRSACQKCKAIVLFGEAALVLRGVLLAEGYSASALHSTDDLRSATHQALRLAASGDAILFAPIFFVEPDERNIFTAAVVEQRSGKH
jgi:UDP-N-acetylmuramoylalanine--D-glutamate ligase